MVGRMPNEDFLRTLSGLLPGTLSASSMQSCFLLKCELL